VRRNYIILLLALSVVEFLPLFLAPTPPGLSGDSLGHLFKVHELMTEGWKPWIEEWYAGFPFLHFYPPASYIMAGILGKLFGGDLRGYAVTLMLTSFLGALGLHVYLRRLRREFYVAPLMFLLFPWRLGVAYVEGNFPRANAINLAPLFLLGVLYLAEYRERYLVLSALMISFVSLTHHSILVPLILVALVLHWDDLKSAHAIGNSLRVGGAVVFLTAFWYVPFLYDMHWADFWRMKETPWLFESYSLAPEKVLTPEILLPIILIIFILLISRRRGVLDIRKLTLIGILVYLSLGCYSPTSRLYSVLPFSLIPPYRWLDMTVLLIPLMAADALTGTRRSRKSIAAIIMVLLLTVPFIGWAKPINPIPKESLELAWYLREQPGDNYRVLIAEADATCSYLPALSGKDTLNGWYHEGNPVDREMDRIWYLLSKGKNASFYLRAYDVRFLVDAEQPGYREIAKVGGYTVYASNVSFVQQVSTVMTGKFYDLPLDYAYVKELPRNLKGVENIIYSGNPDNRTAEELLAFIKNGGTLIWIPSTPESLFGVESIMMPISLSKLSSLIYNVSRFAPFEYESSPWYGPVFRNVTSLIKMGNWTLIGVRKIGRGWLYVLGGNFLYHITYTGSMYEVRILKGLIADGKRLKVENVKRGEGWYSFGIKTGGPTLIRVSEAYFPYWTVRVDGRPTDVIRDDRTGLTLLEVDGSSKVVGAFRDPFMRLRHYSLLAWIIMLLYALAEFLPRRRISGFNGP